MARPMAERPMPPVLVTLAERVLRLPRALRVLIAGVFALLTTLLLTPIIDLIYVNNFFNPSTVILPALVACSIGLVVYVIGWRLIIGTVGETLMVRPATLIYLIAGVLALALVVILVVYGVVSASVYL
jgi:hypothetical protein